MRTMWMRTNWPVVASIATVSGLLGLVGLAFSNTGLKWCGIDLGPWTGLLGLDAGFHRFGDFLIFLVLVAIGSAVATILIGAVTDARTGVVATGCLAVTVGVVGAVGWVLRPLLAGCPILPTDVGGLFFAVGFVSLVGAVPGYLIGRAIVTVAARRSGRLSSKRTEEESR